MTNENGSSPAYPTNELQGSAGDYAMVAVGGLTKREAFAMAAMQGFLANGDNGSEKEWEIAEWSVKTADALLAELAKETT